MRTVSAEGNEGPCRSSNALPSESCNFIVCNVKGELQSLSCTCKQGAANFVETRKYTHYISASNCSNASYSFGVTRLSFSFCTCYRGSRHICDRFIFYLCWNINEAILKSRTIFIDRSNHICPARLFFRACVRNLIANL